MNGILNTFIFNLRVKPYHGNFPKVTFQGFQILTSKYAEEILRNQELLINQYASEI